MPVEMLVGGMRGEGEEGETYKAFEDALAGGCAAGLDLPDMVFGDLLELELI